MFVDLSHNCLVTVFLEDQTTCIQEGMLTHKLELNTFVSGGRNVQSMCLLLELYVLYILSTSPT